MKKFWVLKIQIFCFSAAKFLIGKRDVKNADRQLNITKQEIEFEQKIEWNKVLSRDPFNCALSLVCQLSAGAAKQDEEANKIYEFISWVPRKIVKIVTKFISIFCSHTIEHTKVPKKLKNAYDLGIEYNKGVKSDFKKCYKNYPICPYSADTMLRLIAQMNNFSKFVFGWLRNKRACYVRRPNAQKNV